MEPRIRWWEIREEEFSTMFRQKITQNENWEDVSNLEDMANTIKETASKVFWVTMKRSWRMRKRGGEKNKYKTQ